MSSKIYYFIENLSEIDPKIEMPFEENLVLKSLPLNLLPGLKSLIKGYISERYMPPQIRNDFPSTFHEYKKVKSVSSTVHLVQRDVNDFRYFVIEESNTNQFNVFLPKAFQLVDNDYFIPFAFSINENFVIKHSFSELCVYSYYNDLNIIQPYPRKKDDDLPSRPEPLSLDNQDKEQIIYNLNLLRNFARQKDKYPSIHKALEDFFLIREISDYSVFKIVAYMSCLELLLVDSSQDKLKSINSQLQTKVNLINNQLENPINFSQYIKGPDTLTLGKIIETIYSYRSAIAHGDFIDFEKKLQTLERVSQIKILTFMRVVLKRCLIYSLKNPRLVSDLKKC